MLRALLGLANNGTFNNPTFTGTVTNSGDITGGTIGKTPIPGAVVVSSATTYTVGATDAYLVFTAASAITVTLPTAASNVGRVIHFKSPSTGAINSAASNVIPLNSGATPGTAIALAGKWVIAVCDGTNWQSMAGN